MQIGGKPITRRKLIIFILILLLLGVSTGLAFTSIFPIQKVYILLPVLWSIIVFCIFSLILKWQVGYNLFAELGFLYLALALVYTILPAFAFMVVDLNLASGWVSAKLAPLLPAPSDLGIHLWRHVLFIFGTAAGYLLLRGRNKLTLMTFEDPERRDGPTIILLISMAVICILCLSLLSAPVQTYIDNYTRYDHLSWFPRKFVSLCVRLKIGIYIVFITFLFRNYKKYKLIIPVVIAIICLHETIYSFGARIESLIILLATFCLYNYSVNIITLKRGLLICVAIGVLFSGVELIRASEFNLTDARSSVSSDGVKPASEFGAVYLTSYHLYSERAKGNLPQKEWPMFFFDFISPVTFSDFTQWNPQYWYARNYFPEAVVPPETMGPIAESAIWGGEIDLLFRSLINGVFFAYLVRWFIRWKNKWWGVGIYVYCFATCIMTLKYSVFYHLTPLVKSLLPVLVIVWAVRRFIPSKQRVESAIHV